MLSKVRVQTFDDWLEHHPVVRVKFERQSIRPRSFAEREFPMNSFQITLTRIKGVHVFIVYILLRQTFR
jgi:hypothetical protein